MSEKFGYGLPTGSGMTSESESERNASISHSLSLIDKANAVALENRRKEVIFSQLVKDGVVGLPTHTHFMGGAAWIYDGDIYWLDEDGINCASAEYDYTLIEGYSE